MGRGKKGETPEARYARHAEERGRQDAQNERWASGAEPVPVERSHEYGSRILNAIETNVPYTFNGNVHNTGLITNLLPNAIVEVPIVADAMGLHPCHVGDLLPALAALNRSNLAQELAVKGFVEKDRESIYRAVELDPLTTTILTLPETRRMVDEMFEADRQYITVP